MPEKWGRFAPFTGVVTGALVLIGFISTKTEPGGSASGVKVLSWYASNHSHQRVGDIVLAFGAGFLVFFAASMRSYIRRTTGSGGPATLMLAAAVFAAVGLVIGVATDWVIADNYRALTPSAAQALNTFNNSFLPLPGLFVFYIASGVAVLHSRALPVWIGWVGIVLGVFSVTPAALVAFFGLILWPLILGILIYVRSGRPATEAPAAAPAPA